MKKLLSFLCVLALVLSLTAGCTPKKPSESTAPEASSTEAPNEAPVDIEIMALNGPTAMGLSRFMDQADNLQLTDHRYHFSIAASPDEAIPKIVKGEVDIAAVPANLASVAYNRSQGAVQVLAINTLGVLYIVESGDTVHSVEDLRGKTIVATGKNHTPEQVITYLLTKNGLIIGDDVNIEWKSEAAECLSALMSRQNTIAMLPQPFVSAAQLKSENIRVALDLTKEWDSLQAREEHPSALITGVVIAQKEFVQQHPDAVAAFMEHYQQSVDYVNQNADEAAALVERYGIVKAPVAKKAIPACNIVFIAGQEMKTKLGSYLQVLFGQNPKSVGGQLPGDDFYYVR